MNFQVSGDGRTKPNKLGWAIGEMLPTPTRADYRSVNSNPGARGQSGVMPASEHSLPAKIHQLLPTPIVSDWNSSASEWRQTAEYMQLRDINALLPTPAVNDMGRGKTVEDWDDWTAKMQAAHGNGNGHGKSLEIEALRLLPTPLAEMGNLQRDDFTPNLRTVVEGNRLLLGATTAPPSPDGSTSSDDPHQHQLSLDVQGIFA